MSDEQAVQFLTRARGLIEAGWTQGRYESRTEEVVKKSWWRSGVIYHNFYCVVGALFKAGAVGTTRQRAEMYFAKAIGKKHYNPVYGSGGIMNWNDEPGRTKEQVLDAFDKAIELAKSSTESKPIFTTPPPSISDSYLSETSLKIFMSKYYIVPEITQIGGNKKNLNFTFGKAEWIEERKKKTQPKLDVVKEVQDYVNSLPESETATV